MYIWLHIAIYTHIYSIYTPEWCAKWLPSAFTARKLTCAIPLCHIAAPTLADALFMHLIYAQDVSSFFLNENSAQFVSKLFGNANDILCI